MFKLSSKFQRFKSKRKWNIWQLFHATDFETLMYPCFTFCRILGILPYEIKAATIKTYKLYYILSTIIICVFCICELTLLYDINVFKNIMFQNLPRKLQLNCYFIFGGFMIVFTFILCKPRMRLIQTIRELSLRLPPQSYKNLSTLIHAKDIFGFLFLFLEVSIYFSINFDFLIDINTLYISLLVFQMDMLYMNCVCILKACFKQINDNLASLRKFVVNDKPYIVGETSYRQRNPFLLIKLKALKKHHLVISDTVQMLNMIFSLHLLITTVITFLEVTFMLYFYTMHWKIGTLADNVSYQLYDLLVIIVIIYYVVKIVLIVWACETGKNQAVEINTTVHSVLNNTSDEQIKLEVD